MAGILLLNACQAPYQADESAAGRQVQSGGRADRQDSDGEDIPPAAQAVSPAEKALFHAISSYDNEDFKSSEKELQEALHSGTLGKHDQVVAHKYLAFIFCTSHRKKLCRHEFRTALKIDPGFRLAAAEAGHPMWGPVFRSEKAKYEKVMSAHNER